jgi:uncharacterized protein YkvS
MATSTATPLGTLNRLRTSIQIPNFPSLNVTSSFLGKRSVRITREGRIVENIDALTGIVPSGEPYVKMGVHINLLKSQALANAYEQQLQAQATIGDIIVRTDSVTLQSFTVYNSSIINVEELDFSGTTADYMVTLEGYYPVNASLYNT